jgi:PAS domain S-box-containing protein
MPPVPSTDNPLKLILDTVLDAVVVMGENDRVLEWNDRATELFGWNRGEVVGGMLARFIIPERYRVAHLEGLKRYLATGEGPVLGKRIEISALKKDGTEFPVELAISPFHQEGRLIFVGCMRDISAKREVQESLHRSETNFNLLVQSAKDYAIYMLSAEGAVLNWNSGAERIKGYTPDEIIGKPFSLFYTPEDIAEGVPAKALRTAREYGKFEAEGWRVRKDGNRFWASVTLRPMEDQQGSLVGFVKITRDESERKAAQELLRQTQERMVQMQKMEAVGQLTGGVAHDFNNLLMIIIGNLETAQRHIGSLEQDVAARVRRVVDHAMGGAQRAASLTQRLLAFSRRQPLEPKRIDVDRFVAGAADFLQRSLGERVEVETVGAGGLWPIEVDTHQLESALLNIAVNARDAMSDGGKLTIETGNVYLDRDYSRAHPEVPVGQYVMISASDTGTGMPPDVVARAFEPFFTTKDIGHGTGLGLSQVYGFVKQSGGHIKIYSEPGQGTSVKLYFPRAAGKGTDAGLGKRNETVAPGVPGETILLVEDDPGVRSYLEESLGFLKYHVLVAQDGAEALQILEHSGQRIDLMLTDVVLPGLNGRQVADRALQVRPDLKIIFMTGYSRNAIVHHGRLDRGVELLQKPISQAELSSRLRDVLDLPLTTPFAG